MMPIIDNIYKKYNLDINDPTAAATLLATAGWKASNIRSQANPSICPLYQ